MLTTELQQLVANLVQLIPGYNPLSFDEAVHMMADYSSDPVLGQYWIPLLGSAGGDIYAAVWNPGEDAKVAGFLVGEPTEVEFSSIEQMVSVFNGCYRDRAFFLIKLAGLRWIRPAIRKSIHGLLENSRIQPVR